MSTFGETAHVIDDLKVVLIRNMTEIEFVTSDNPAILTNRWYLQHETAKHKSYGTGNSGALFFLPIAPKILCVIYDGDVYSMPHDRGWIDDYKASDIDLFNEFQILNCAANIYFSDWGQVLQLHQLHGRVMHLRPKLRHEIITSVLEHEDEEGRTFRVVNRNEIADHIVDHKDVLLHVKNNRPPPTHWPSIIRWRENKRVYSNGSGVGFVRKSQVERGHGYQKIY